jgi:hypothetical protein
VLQNLRPKPEPTGIGGGVFIVCSACNLTFSDRQLSFDTPHALIWLVLGVAVVAWLLITTP